MIPSTSKVSELTELKTKEDLEAVKQECTDKPVLILFWASWDASSSVLKEMMAEMPKVYSKVRLAYVDCDESDLVDILDVETV